MKTIYLGILIFLQFKFYYSLPQTRNYCEYGCKECRQNYTESTCISCDEGYTLNSENSFCEYRKCDTNLVFQKSIKEVNCVAICNSPQIADQDIKQCINSEECHKFYISKSYPSQKIQIRNIYIYSEEYLLILYDSYFNIVDRNTGEIVQNIQYKQGTIKLQIFYDIPFLISSNQTINQWDFMINQSKFIAQVPQGVFFQNSEIFNVDNKVACISSFSIDLKLMYITPILVIQSDTLSQITSNAESISVDISQYNAKFLRGKYLVETQDSTIRVKKLQINPKEQLKVQFEYLLSSFIKCEGVNQIQEFSYALDIDQFDKNIMININELPYFLVIDITTQKCRSLKLESNPLQFQVINYDNKTQSYQILIQSSNKLLIYQQSFNLIQSISSQQNINDFLSVVLQNQIYKIYLLLDNKQIVIYNLNLSSDKNADLKYIGNRYIQITDPKFLYFDNYSKTKQTFNTLFVYNYDCQSINQLIDETTYILSQFEMNYISHKTSVTSISVTQNQQYVVSASKDGNIILWQIFNKYEGYQIFSFNNITETCQLVQIFKERYILAKYSTQFIKIDILKPYDQQQKIILNQNQGQQTKGILIIEDEFILFQGSCAAIFNMKFQQVFQYCMEDFSKALAFQLTNDKLILIQTDVQIYLYKINYSDKSFTKQYTYTSSSTIKLLSMRVFSNKSYQFVIVDIKFNIIQINSQLILKNQYQLDTVKAVLDLDYPINSDEDIYSLLAIHKDPTLQAKFYIYRIAFDQNPVVDYWYSFQIASEFTVFYITQDSLGYYFYNIIVMMTTTSHQIMIPFIVNKATKDIQFGLLDMSPANKLSAQITPYNNTGILSQFFGMESGQVQYSPHYKNQYQTIFKSSSGIINKIHYSIKLQSYYIITQQVNIYNIHTNQLEEQLIFQKTDEIINLTTSNELRISLFFQSYEVVLKNHKTNQTMQNNTLDLIKGIHIDEQRSLIYIYGSNFASYTLDMEQKQIIENLNILQCVFSSDIAFCKVDNFEIQAYSLIGFSLIFKINPTGLPNNYTLYIDLNYQYIFCYYQSVQIYKFSGDFVASLTQVVRPLIQIKLCGTKIVLYTIGNLYILSRDKLEQRANLNSPGGGNIIWTKYIEESNQLIFSSDLIRVAQIFIYDLSSLSEPVGVSNALYLQKDLAVGYYYDKTQSSGYFCDRLGQITVINVLLANSQFNFFSLIQKFKTDNLIHYELNPQMNKILLGNSQNVYLVDLAQLNRQTQYFYQEKVQKYLLIKNNNQNILLLVDKQNFIYKYSNYSLRFVTFFEESILDIQLLETSNEIMIVLQTQIYLFDQSNLILSSNKIQPKQIIKEFLYKEYLGKEIFLTQDQRVIHYIFKSNKIIEYSFEFENDLIINKYWTQQGSILLLGMNNGYVLIYNLIIQKFQTISDSQSIQPIKCFIEMPDSTILAFQKNGNILKINDIGNKMTTKIIKISYLMQYDDMLEDELDLYNAIFDVKYNKIYCWMVLQQRLYVLDSNNFNIKTFISFPSNEINRLQIGDDILILYSQFQIHVYSRLLLEFQFSIKKSSRHDKIINLILMQDKFLAISLLSKVEVYMLNLITQTFSLVDEITTQNPILSSCEIIKNDDLTQLNVHLIGYSKTNIFDKIYNLNLILKQQNQCSSTLNASSTFKLKSEFEINKLQNSNMTYTFFLKINSSLETINVLDQQSSKLVISPLDLGNEKYGMINLKTTSFLIIKKDLIIQNFQLNFIEKGTYLTNTESQNIIFESVFIDSNNIEGVSLKYVNKTQIIFKKLTIKGNQKLRILQESNQQKNSLFLLQNIGQVSIYDLIIENVNLNQNQLIFIFNNVQSLNIKGITIKNCKITQIFEFSQIQSLELQDILITENQILQIQPISNSLIYLIEINGIQETNMKNITISKNNNIFFLKTLNTYTIGNKILTLTDDVLNIQNLYLKNNLFQGYGYIASNITKKFILNQAMIEFMNEYIQIENTIIQDNQSNMKILSAQNAIFKNCSFIKNTSLKGGGLFIQIIKNEIQILNSTISQNRALEDGGGIFMDNVNIIRIGEYTNITENRAYIGGGVKFTNLKSQINISEDTVVRSNQAEIFGNNIANYPTQIKIKIDYDSTSVKFQFTQQKGQVEDEEQEQIVDIQNFQSGGSMNITIQYIDNDFNILQLSDYKLQNNEYPKSIIEDIKRLNFLLSSNKQVFLSDEGTINFLQYDENSQGFVKKDLIVSALPNSIQKMTVKYQINSEETLKSIQFKIQFRQCETGEVEKKISSKNIHCQSCPFGFYSLQQFSNQDNNTENIQCTKCPDSAHQCEKNTIQIKNGYWRKNNKTDEIFLCENNEEACIPEDKNSIYGCLEGHVGPLCEQCDLQGRVWNSKKYSQSISKSNCSECSDMKLQTIYISFTMIAMLIYLYSSFLIFVSSYEKSLICYYMRKLSLLPFSVTQYHNKSNFFMKILVNYFQILSVLQQFQIKYLPQILAKAPSFLGSAVSQITIDVLCLFSSEQINNYGQGKLKQIIQSVIPALFTIILLIAVNIMNYMNVKNMKSHSMYTLINFLFIFFQIDSLHLFARSLRCRQIGSEHYLQQDLLFSCDDESYKLFSKYFTIPNLLFWVAYPIIPLIYLYRNKNKLETCLIKFKVGYYYSEFKQEFYYWEFIRIYLKVIIVVMSTILSEYQIINSLFLNLIIFLYVNKVIKNNPFFSKKLKELEVNSYNNLSILIIIQALIKYKNESFFVVIYFITLYLYVLYMVLVIIIEMVNTNNKLGKVLRQLLVFTLGKKRFEKIFKQNLSSNNLLAVRRWKKILENIHFLTKNKAMDIIKTAPKQKSNRMIDDGLAKIQHTIPTALSIRTKRLESYDVCLKQRENSSNFRQQNSTYNQEQKYLRQYEELYQKNNKSNIQTTEIQNNENISRREFILDNTIDKLMINKKESIYTQQANSQKPNQFQDEYQNTDIFNQTNHKQHILQNSQISVTDITDSQQYEEVYTGVENIKSNNYQTFHEKGQNNIQNND